MSDTEDMWRAIKGAAAELGASIAKLRADLDELAQGVAFAVDAASEALGDLAQHSDAHQLIIRNYAHELDDLRRVVASQLGYPEYHAPECHDRVVELARTAALRERAARADADTQPIDPRDFERVCTCGHIEPNHGETGGLCFEAGCPCTEFVAVGGAQ